MTHREKTLASALGGVLLLAAAYALVQQLVVRPFGTVRARLAAAEQRRAELRRRVAAESQWPDTWRELAGRTLHTDPDLAQQLFREDVQNLLVTHGLNRTGRIASGMATTDRKTELTEVPVTVTADGTLPQVIGFVRDLYRRPYLVQVSSLIIDAGETRPKKAEADPSVKLTVKAATLLVPKLPDVKTEPIGELERIRDQLDESRLARSSEAYEEIPGRNIYQWPERPKPPPIVQAPDRPEKPREAPRPAPPPNPRPDAAKLRLIGTTSLNGELLVYVRHDDRLSEPPAEYRLDDELDLGRIVLIHPTGMVIRVREGNGANGQQVDYFYALNATFSERERLDPRTHPDICEALELALAP